MQTILAKLEKLDQLEQVLFKRDVTIEPERETPPALPFASVTNQAVTQEASALAALLPALPEEVKSVVDAYLSGIVKHDICSHLKWSSRKYTCIVKPVLDQLQA